MKISIWVALLFSFSVHAADKHWGYTTSDTTVGPEGWGKLPGDELCSIGAAQTPIDLPISTPVHPKASALHFHYQAAPLLLENNGHSIVVTDPKNSLLHVKGKSYRLLQLHFHAPSEHSIDGKFFPLEAHFVHVDGLGKPALVVGVFIKEGPHNPAFDDLFSDLPKKPGGKKDLSKIQFNPEQILPKDHSYFHYQGSLTTPPCTEGLQWYVLKTPITLDSDQIRAFTSIPGLGHTNRPIQPLGARKLEQSASAK